MAVGEPLGDTPPSLKLVYFDVAGKAECLRLALAHAGIDFEDMRVGFKEFGDLKASGQLPFGQVPCLIVHKDSHVVQTAAILRYIGKISAGRTAHPLYPSDPVAAATVDAIVDQDTDMMTGFICSQYSSRFGFGDVVEKSGSPEKRARFGLVRRRLNDEVIPRHLDALDALLAKSATGWLAGGEGPTIADFMMVPSLQRLRGRADGPPMGLGDGLSAGLVERRPRLVALIERLMALPRIQAWYAGRGQRVTYLHLPRVGFGTFNNFSGSPQAGEDEALRGAIEAAIDAGYRHFDCAELYRNEASIGEALAKAQHDGKVTRSELFLVSKAWNHRRTTGELRAAVEGTLKALQTEYLDMYLIHWPVCWTAESLSNVVDTTPEGSCSIKVGKEDPRAEAEALAEAWVGMEALVEAGLVRQIGVSNFGVARLQRLLGSCRIRPACNQVECHPHLAQVALRSFCQQEYIDLVAYHPIGKPGFREEGQPVAIKEPCIVAIAERLGCTPVQVVLAWHLAKGVVAIPKSATPSRIAENIAAREVKLTPEDVAAIDALDCGARFCAPGWMASWE